jgi:hypothetical protein
MPLITLSSPRVIQDRPTVSGPTFTTLAFLVQRSVSFNYALINDLVLSSASARWPTVTKLMPQLSFPKQQSN